MNEPPKHFNPWEKVKHAWDKPENIDFIEQHNVDALPDEDDLIAVLEDFAEYDPEILEIILTSQPPHTIITGD